MTLLIAVALFAQVFNATSAYTTADPVDPARLGLATLTGRYSIVLGDGCDGIEAGMNVELVTGSDDSAVLNDGCSIVLGPRMSTVPCFLNDVAMCDVAAEQQEAFSGVH